MTGKEMDKIFQTIATNDIVTVTGAVSAIYSHNHSLQLHDVTTLKIDNVAFSSYDYVVFVESKQGNRNMEKFVGKVGKILSIQHPHNPLQHNYGYYRSQPDYDPISIEVQFEITPKNVQTISVQKNEIRRAIPSEIEEEKKRMSVECKNEKETLFKKYVAELDKEQLANAMKYMFEISMKK